MPKRNPDSRARLHRLVTDSAMEPALLTRSPNVVQDKIQAPVIWTSEHSQYDILTLADVRT